MVQNSAIRQVLSDTEEFVPYRDAAPFFSAIEFSVGTGGRIMFQPSAGTVGAQFASDNQGMIGDVFSANAGPGGEVHFLLTTNKLSGT